MIYSYMGGIFIHCIGVTHCVVLCRGVVKSFAGQNLKGKTQNLIGKALQKVVEH